MTEIRSRYLVVWSKKDEENHHEYYASEDDARERVTELINDGSIYLTHLLEADETGSYYVTESTEDALCYTEEELDND